MQSIYTYPKDCDEAEERQVLESVGRTLKSWESALLKRSNSNPDDAKPEAEDDEVKMRQVLESIGRTLKSWESASLKRSKSDPDDAKPESL